MLANVQKAGTADEILKSSLEVRIAREKDIAGKMYARLEKIAGNAPIAPTNAVSKIDDILANQSKRAPNKELVDELQDVKKQLLSNDPSLGVLDYKELRALQSRLSELSVTKQHGGFTEVKIAVDDDLLAFAEQSNNPNLLKELKKINNFYKNIKNREEVVAKALDSNEPDRIYKELRGFFKMLFMLLNLFCWIILEKTCLCLIWSLKVKL